MSDTTDQKDSRQPPVPVQAPLSPRELAVALVKHYGLHEGTYDLLLEFQIGVGPVGPSKDMLTPGAMIGVTRFGLMPASAPGLQTVDAAEVNPDPKKLKPKTAASSRKKTSS